MDLSYECIALASNNICIREYKTARDYQLMDCGERTSSQCKIHKLVCSIKWSVDESGAHVQGHMNIQV